MAYKCEAVTGVYENQVKCRLKATSKQFKETCATVF